MAPTITFYDRDGKPMAAPAQRGLAGGRPTPAALTDGGRWGVMAYDAADVYGPHMADWRPMNWSADASLNPVRDRISARSRDIERNDGWAKSGATSILDTVVGASLRPIFKPNYIALAFYTGNSKFDASWAAEYSQALNACYEPWANDIGHWNDAQRKLTLTQQFWLALRHKLIDGDALGKMLYRPEKIGSGRARYATALQLIDPDRLSNPQMVFDSFNCRGGVQIDPEGAPVGYHIRRAHLGDWFAAAKSMEWDYVPAETSWGRPIIVHDYDHDLASQHRGGAGIFTAVMQRLKMLIKYDGTELDAAIINAIFAAYVKSPYDPEMVEAALSEGPNRDGLGVYQDMRAEFWDGKRMDIGGARMTHLAPGEELGTVQSSRPSSNFEPFEATILRHVAAGVPGVTYESLTGDYSRTNYSSFRGAANEARKSLDRRAASFYGGFANPVVGCFVEEVHDVEDLPMPGGEVIDFADGRSMYARCHWIGPGAGYVDEVQEKQGALLGLGGAMSTLEIECARQGLNYREVVHQRSIELKELKDAGIDTMPTWAIPQPGKEAGDKPPAPGSGR
jgi:lambda family phage portal protein